MILEALMLLGEKSDAKSNFDAMVARLGSQSWYSTQTTAYMLMGLAKFVGANDKDPIDVRYSFNGGKKAKVKTLKSSAAVTMPSDKDGKVDVVNRSKKRVFLTVSLRGKPLVGDSVAVSNNLIMSVVYRTLDGASIDPASIVQGTDFYADVTIRHPGRRADYKEMALSQVFPSGWEIRNSRMGDGELRQKGDTPTYQDIRDDRVYSYFDVRRGYSKNFKIMLHAAYVGEFMLPMVSCEAMYDNEIQARTVQKTVKVVEKK